MCHCGVNLYDALAGAFHLLLALRQVIEVARASPPAAGATTPYEILVFCAIVVDGANFSLGPIIPSSFAPLLPSFPSPSIYSRVGTIYKGNNLHTYCHVNTLHGGGEEGGVARVGRLEELEGVLGMGSWKSFLGREEGLGKTFR